MADTMSPEDKLAVIDLIADYGFRLDAADLDGYVNNFMPDGVFDGGGGALHGRDEIRAYVGHLIEIGEAGPDGPARLRHILGIPSVHGDSERCRARTYVMIPGHRPVQGSDGKEVFVPMVGTYTDDIVKHEGRWRFAKREIRMHLTGPSRR
jgi:hypothetical protein